MSQPPNSSNAILLAAIAAAIVLAVVAWSLSGLGKGGAPIDADDASERIAPVARFELQSASAGAGATSPQGVYNATCAACHGTGVAGAPKKGDKAAWAPRLANGLDALVKAAIAGKGAMPPKGGAGHLSDAEFKAVVEYISK